MEIVGYNVTFSNAIGGFLVRHFVSFDDLVRYFKPLVTSGYSMYVVAVFE